MNDGTAQQRTNARSEEASSQQCCCLSHHAAKKSLVRTKGQDCLKLCAPNYDLIREVFSPQFCALFNVFNRLRCFPPPAAHYEAAAQFLHPSFRHIWRAVSGCSHNTECAVASGLLDSVGNANYTNIILKPVDFLPPVHRSKISTATLPNNVHPSHLSGSLGTTAMAESVMDASKKRKLAAGTITE